jgi:uncharacterized protein (DUF433 family)
MSHTGRTPRAPADEIRAMLSLRETTLLAGVSETRVRKDIETGVLLPIKAEDRLLFRWADAYILAAVYRGNLLSGTLRRKALEELEGLLEPACRRRFYALLDVEALIAAKCMRQWPGRFFACSNRLELESYLFIDVARVVKDVAPRVDLYAEGLSRIEEREGLLGGEAVYRNTRLSVRHIGKMRDGGESIENIVGDYPYLHRNDIEFAQLYYKAHPLVGRPSAPGEVDLAGIASSR